MSKPKDLYDLETLCARIINNTMIPTNTTDVVLNIKLRYGERMEYNASLTIKRKVFAPPPSTTQSTSGVSGTADNHRTAHTATKRLTDSSHSTRETVT